MAPIEYSGAVTKGGESENIFQGLRFFLAAHVPLRSRYKLDIEKHGGTVVHKEEPDAIIIVDHLKAKQITTHNTYSYKLIDDSLKKGSLENKDSYSISPAQEASRPAGDLSIRRRSARTPFTKEEDCWLWDYMTDAISKGAAHAGRTIFQQIHAERPDHSWQSWRERWLKKLNGTQRPLPLENSQSARREHSAPLDQATAQQEVPNPAPLESVTPEDDAAAAPAPAPPHPPPPPQKDPEQREPNIDASAEDQLELWKNSRTIYSLERFSDEYADRWKELASLEDYKHHSAEEWQMIWEQLVRPGWLESLPKAENPKDVKDVRPTFGPDTIQVDRVSERGNTQDSLASQEEQNQSLNLVNLSRHPRSAKNRVRISQSSSSQTQMKGSSVGKRRRASDFVPDNSTVSLSPRSSKRVKPQGDTASVGEEMQDERLGRQSGNESTNEEVTISLESGPAESTLQAIHDQVDAQHPSSIQHESRKTDMSQQKSDPSNESSDSERLGSREDAGRDNKGQTQPPTSQNEEISTESDASLSEDEPGEESEARRTPALDTQAFFREESPGLFFDMPSPGLDPIDAVQVPVSQLGHEPSPSDFTTTTPGNTAPPARMSPLPSQRNNSTAGSYIFTTQPGFTSQPRMSSSSGLGSKTSLISSSRESSRNSHHVTVHAGGRLAEANVEPSEKEVGRWWAAKRDSKETEENIKIAYEASCGHFNTANMALIHLRLSKRLPDKRGVWTEQDDVDLQDRDARQVQRVINKHGDKNVQRRMDWMNEKIGKPH